MLFRPNRNPHMIAIMAETEDRLDEPQHAPFAAINEPDLPSDHPLSRYALFQEPVGTGS